MILTHLGPRSMVLLIRTSGSSANCSWCTGQLHARPCNLKSLSKKSLRLELNSVRIKHPGRNTARKSIERLKLSYLETPYNQSPPLKIK
jgi:hypothetical protein